MISRKQSGFTILELIIGLILALTLPRFHNLTETRLKADTRKVAALIQYLDEAASTKKIYYKIRFDLDKELLQVETSKNGLRYINEENARIGVRVPSIKTYGAIEKT